MVNISIDMPISGPLLPQIRIFQIFQESPLDALKAVPLTFYWRERLGCGDMA